MNCLAEVKQVALRLGVGERAFYCLQYSGFVVHPKVPRMHVESLCRRIVFQEPERSGVCVSRFVVEEEVSTRNHSSTVECMDCVELMEYFRNNTKGPVHINCISPAQDSNGSF